MTKSEISGLETKATDRNYKIVVKVAGDGKTKVTLTHADGHTFEGVWSGRGVSTISAYVNALNSAVARMLGYTERFA